MFDGTRNKLRSFVSHQRINLAGDASHFPNSQYQLWYTFVLPAGQAFTQVKTYITDKGINLVDVPALIAVFKTGFGNPDCVAIAEWKLVVL
jgi:hypothetical protein